MLHHLNNPNTIIIIGRANSGTRIIPEALIEAGVFMGAPLNIASDLLPPNDLYECCRIFGTYVDRTGPYDWDFTRALDTEPPKQFQELQASYLQSVIQSEDIKKGWKLPENTLIYPWLVKLLPHASFIHWIRHPEGNCKKMTGVDRLEKWNIPAKKYLLHEWNYKMRAVSWKYHYDIIEQTPRPKHFLRMRYEDYVLSQEESKTKVEEFLNIQLPMLSLNKAKAGPYSNKYRSYKFLQKCLDELSYP